MKLPFILIFSVLTVTVYAEQYVAAPVRYSERPMSEAVQTYTGQTYSSSPAPPAFTNESPVISDGAVMPGSAIMPGSAVVTVIEDQQAPFQQAPLLTPLPFDVTQLEDKPVLVPQPLGPLLPMQDQREQGQRGQDAADVPATVWSATAWPATVRGQVETVDNLKETLESPLPPALGVIDAGTIDPKLTQSAVMTPDAAFEEAIASAAQNAPEGALPSSAAASDPLGYGVLLAAMVVTTIGLVYMAFVAYDYRQRWMQSLTVQNDRYLGGTFDLESEDAFGAKSWG